MIVFGMPNGAEVSYAPSADDELWLRRAVAGEGRVEAQVAQVLVNRFAYLLGTAVRTDGAPFYPTLAEFVQAYAQPINPRWMRGGDKFEERFPDASREYQRKLEAGHARRAVHRRMTDFDDATLTAVRTALHVGPIDIEPGWLHYSAPGSERPGMKPVTPPRRGTNQIFGVKGADAWGGYSVPGAAELADRHPPELLKYAPAVLIAAALYLLNRKG